jgi:hypothetical protein
MKMGLQRAVALCDKTRFMHHKKAKFHKNFDIKKDINWLMHTVGVIVGPPNS